MKKSTDYILTTHTGSLPRGKELNDLLIADEAGEKVDKAKLDDMIDKRVAYVMEKQRWAGVDVANDGEQGRVGFQTYVPKRMSGFGGESKRPFGQEWIQLAAVHAKVHGADSQDRQGLRLSRSDRRASNITTRKRSKSSSRVSSGMPMRSSRRSPKCSSPSRRRASSPARCSTRTTRPMRTISTRSRGRSTTNIKSVVDAGYVLQIDAPDLAMERVLLFQDKIRRRIRQDRRAAYRLAEQGAARHPARPRAAAHLLGQLGRPAHLRHRARAAVAGVLSSQCRRARHRVRQCAPSARICGAARSTNSPTT